MSSFFGINVLTESTCGASKYKYVGEATEVQQIMFEAAQDLSQIQNGLYIADFGINVLTESTCGASKYKYVGEATEVQQIMFEAAQDLSQIQNGLYIADAMLESAVLFEGDSQETLVENVVKDFFQKIIDAFKKLWNKLKAWFKISSKVLKIYEKN